MNILFIAPNVCMDNSTGDVIHVTELANSFSKLGHDVFLIARLSKSQNNCFNFLFNFRSIESITYRRLWIPHVMISAFFSTLSLLISKKIDLIYERHHVFGIGVILGKIFRIPTTVEVNGIVIEEMKILDSFNPLTINLARVIESFTLRNAIYVVSVTEGIKKYLKENYRIDSNRIFTISNGVNTDLFKQIDNTKEVLNLNPQFNYVLFVGSLVDWQGVDTLIKASPLVLKDMPKTRFLIVGDGPMKVSYMDLVTQITVSEKFSFIGTVPHELVPLYINASDICVVPKKPLESGYSPLKLYEYMACGKPVVASNIPGFEILSESNSGLLFEPENPKELANTILKLLHDERLRIKMGNNALDISKNNSWNKVAQHVLEMPKKTYDIN
jgi:glycosyltransferase involved in cell wall biosynthesis